MQLYTESQVRDIAAGALLLGADVGESIGRGEAQTAQRQSQARQQAQAQQAAQQRAAQQAAQQRAAQAQAAQIQMRQQQAAQPQAYGAAPGYGHPPYGQNRAPQQPQQPVYNYGATGTVPAYGYPQGVPTTQQCAPQQYAPHRPQYFAAPAAPGAVPPAVQHYAQPQPLQAQAYAARPMTAAHPHASQVPATPSGHGSVSAGILRTTPGGGHELEAAVDPSTSKLDKEAAKALESSTSEAAKKLRSLLAESLDRNVEKTTGSSVSASGEARRKFDPDAASDALRPVVVNVKASSTSSTSKGASSSSKEDEEQGNYQDAFASGLLNFTRAVRPVWLEAVTGAESSSSGSGGAGGDDASSASGAFPLTGSWGAGVSGGCVGFLAPIVGNFVEPVAKRLRGGAYAESSQGGGASAGNTELPRDAVQTECALYRRQLFDAPAALEERLEKKLAECDASEAASDSPEPESFSSAVEEKGDTGDGESKGEGEDDSEKQDDNKDSKDATAAAKKQNDAERAKAAEKKDFERAVATKQKAELCLQDAEGVAADALIWLDERIERVREERTGLHKTQYALFTAPFVLAFLFFVVYRLEGFAALGGPGTFLGLTSQEQADALYSDDNMTKRTRNLYSPFHLPLNRILFCRNYEHEDEAAHGGESVRHKARGNPLYSDTYKWWTNRYNANAELFEDPGFTKTDVPSGDVGEANRMVDYSSLGLGKGMDFRFDDVRARRIRRRLPPLGRRNGWGVSYLQWMRRWIVVGKGSGGRGGAPSKISDTPRHWGKVPHKPGVLDLDRGVPLGRSGNWFDREMWMLYLGHFLFWLPHLLLALTLAAAFPLVLCLPTAYFFWRARIQRDWCDEHLATLVVYRCVLRRFFAEQRGRVQQKLMAVGSVVAEHQRKQHLAAAAAAQKEAQKQRQEAEKRNAEIRERQRQELEKQRQEAEKRRQELEKQRQEQAARAAAAAAAAPPVVPSAPPAPQPAVRQTPQRQPTVAERLAEIMVEREEEDRREAEAVARRRRLEEEAAARRRREEEERRRRAAAAQPQETVRYVPIFVEVEREPERPQQQRRAPNTNDGTAPPASPSRPAPAAAPGGASAGAANNGNAGAASGGGNGGHTNTSGDDSDSDSNDEEFFCVVCQGNDPAIGYDDRATRPVTLECGCGKPCHLECALQWRDMGNDTCPTCACELADWGAERWKPKARGS